MCSRVNYASAGSIDAHGRHARSVSDGRLYTSLCPLSRQRIKVESAILVVIAALCCLTNRLKHKVRIQVIVVFVVDFVVTTNLAAMIPRTQLVVSLRVSLLVSGDWTRDVLHNDVVGNVGFTRHRHLFVKKIEDLRALQKVKTFTLRFDL